MKLFITSKIYDTEKQTIEDIEKAVQEDLDSYVGMNKVKFNLYTLENIAAMFFYRNIDYSALSSNPETIIYCADTFIISGDGFQDFRLPVPLPPMPYISRINYNLGRTDFLNLYKKNAKILGASKIDDAWLEIGNSYIVLRVKTRE